MSAPSVLDWMVTTTAIWNECAENGAVEFFDQPSRVILPDPNNNGKSFTFSPGFVPLALSRRHMRQTGPV